jgi:quercetin dioxygenase-like cupin family protein
MKETIGITATDAGLGGVAWNVVGHIYTPKLHSDNAMIWHALVPAETFVPPHVHPTQDEWILVTEGELEMDFGYEEGNVKPNKAGAGDLVRMPMGVAHGVYNRSGAEAKCVFGVAPSRKLYDLFCALDGVTDPVELVRISALHEVDFLPPPPDA